MDGVKVSSPGRIAELTRALDYPLRFPAIGSSSARVVRLTRFVQVWLAVWFGFLVLLTTSTVPAALLGTTEPRAVFGLLILLLMWAVGLSVLYFGCWMGRDDRAEIEERLREALSSELIHPVPARE